MSSRYLDIPYSTTQQYTHALSRLGRHQRLCAVIDSHMAASHRAERRGDQIAMTHHLQAIATLLVELYTPHPQRKPKHSKHRQQVLRLARQRCQGATIRVQATSRRGF